jgi:hypothetical protein
MSEKSGSLVSMQSSAKQNLDRYLTMHFTRSRCPCMTWRCSERGHRHDMYCNIKSSNADGPLHSTNQRLILLNVVFTEKLGGVDFWMIVWFQRRLWMVRRRFTKESLVVVYHLLDVPLGWDAQLVLIISGEWHAEMVFNLPSTLKLEVVLFSSGCRWWPWGP